MGRTMCIRANSRRTDTEKDMPPPFYLYCLGPKKIIKVICWKLNSERYNSRVN